MSINVPLLLTYIVSIVIMIGLPVFLAFFVTKRFKVGWAIILTGVVTFLVSQALKIPATYGVNALFSKGILPYPSDKWVPVLTALLAGFMAGFFEESCRYFGFKFLKRKAKPYTSSVGLGIGHGGIESILLASIGTIATLITVLFYNAGGQIAKGVSTDTVSYMLSQISSFWATPWLSGLLPGIERLIALSSQILLSVLVWKAVVNRQALWFVLALVYHTALDAVATYLQQLGWGYWGIEAVLAIFLLANLYMIYYFWKEESNKAEEAGEDEEEDEEDDDDDDEEDDDDDENDEEDENEDESDVEETKTEEEE